MTRMEELDLLIARAYPKGRHTPKQKASYSPAPLDPTRCLVCHRATEDLQPIYGKRLPGACAKCWPEAREYCLRFKAAWMLQLAPASIAAGGSV